MTTTALRILAGILTGGLVLAALGWVSRAPYDAPGSDDALLRLSWRMQSAESQVCRDRTQAELDALPAHMRTPQVCESRPLVYELESTIDDGPEEERRVRAAGARGDRPLVVWHEVRLEPGRHRVRVHFHREGGTTAEQLTFDGAVDAVPGKVVLITLDETGRLVAR